MSKESKNTNPTDKESKDIPKNIFEALIRVVWASRYRAPLLIFIAVVIGLYTFFGGLTTEFILKPFFSEKIRVIKYESQWIRAVDLLRSSDPEENIGGISLFQELALSYPYKRQVIINTLQNYLMDAYPQDKEINKNYLKVLEQAIRTITTIPRHDDNGFPLNIDIHKIRIERLDLSGTNFQDISLWGNQFVRVIFSRSSFKNSDLGGTQFIDCSLEYSDLEGARLTRSFMDKENGVSRPTRFKDTKLFKSTIEKADMDSCEISGFTDIEVDKLTKCDKR